MQSDSSTSVHSKFSGNQANPLSQHENSEKQTDLGYYPAIKFSINRYVLLLILLVYTVFVGPNYFNWFSWEKVFRETGTYAHLCDGTSESRSPIASTTAPFCNDRKKATDRLFLIVQAFTFCFSFVAGLLLDVIGAKASCAFGNLLLILGWGTVMLSSKKNELFPLAFALIGAGTDASFFGNLSFSNVFPENPSLIISLLGAARSVSNFLPKFFVTLANRNPSIFTMRGIAFIFVVMYIGCLIISLVLIPRVPYTIIVEEDGDDGKESSHIKSLPASNDVSSNRNSCRLEQSHLPKAFSGSVDSSEKLSAFERSKGIVQQLCREMMFPIKQLRSSIYFPIVIYCIVNILRNGYYTVSAKDRLGPAFAVLEVMILLAFLPGPICGYLVNKVGPFPVMHALNICIGAVFVFVFLADISSNETLINILCYTSTVFALPFMGFILSQVYCYIAIVFEPKDLGKLVGFSSLVAGFCGLLTEVLTSIARDIGFVYVDLSNVIISIASGFLLVYVAREVKIFKQKQMRDRTVVSEP